MGEPLHVPKSTDSVWPTANEPVTLGTGATAKGSPAADTFTVDVNLVVDVGVRVSEERGEGVWLGSGTGAGFDVSTGAAPDVSTETGVEVGVAELGAGGGPASAAKTGDETPSCTRVEIANAKPIDALTRLDRPRRIMWYPKCEKQNAGTFNLRIQESGVGFFSTFALPICQTLPVTDGLSRFFSPPTQRDPAPTGRGPFASAACARSDELEKSSELNWSRD